MPTRRWLVEWFEIINMFEPRRLEVRAEQFGGVLN
jgi:hypothetical protein